MESEEDTMKEDEAKNWWLPVSLHSIVQFYFEKVIRKELTLVDWALDVKDQRILLHLFDFGKKKNG